MSSVKQQPTESDGIIAQLFPGSVSGLILPIDDYTSHLSTDEYEIIRKARDKRKFEFSTGRWCVKQLLRPHNLNNVSILAGDNREPVWPATIKGSISHCKDICGAVTTTDINIVSLGFDIENIRDFKEDIAQIICTEEERVWLYQQKGIEHDTLVLLIFSIKEAIYKCAFAFDSIKAGFQDYSIVLDLKSYTAVLSNQSQQKLPDLELRFLITQKHIYSSALILK